MNRAKGGGHVRMCLAHSESTQHAFLTLRTYYCTCTMCRAQVRGQEHQSQGRWGPGLVETPVVEERPINRQRNRGCSLGSKGQQGCWDRHPVHLSTSLTSSWSPAPGPVSSMAPLPSREQGSVFAHWKNRGSPPQVQSPHLGTFLKQVTTLTGSSGGYVRPPSQKQGAMTAGRGPAVNAGKRSSDRGRLSQGRFSWGTKLSWGRRLSSSSRVTANVF